MGEAGGIGVETVGGGSLGRMPTAGWTTKMASIADETVGAWDR